MLKLAISNSRDISQSNAEISFPNIFQIDADGCDAKAEYELTVNICSKVMSSLLRTKNCSGVALYPAIDKNNLVLLAYALDSQNTLLKGNTNYCAVSCSSDSSEKSRIVSLKEAEKMTKDFGFGNNQEKVVEVKNFGSVLIQSQVYSSSLFYSKDQLLAFQH